MPLKSCGAFAFNDQLNGVDLAMVQTSVVFGGTISKVGLARCPFNFKLALFTSIFDPVGVHICGLCSFLLHDASEHSMS